MSRTCVYDRDGVVLHLGDCRDVLATLSDASVDAVVTDPPYNLRFMGQKWDGTGIAFDEKVWSEVLRVLKPGGHLLAFGGSRTSHRLASAVEDAGFVIRDSIAWLYGGGLPKGVGQMKPAFELIIVARKSLARTLAVNVSEYGTGLLHIDACRIASTDSQLAEKYASVQTVGLRDNAVYGADSRVRAGSTPHPLGRWPANVVLDEPQSATLDIESGVGASRFFYCARASRQERPEVDGKGHSTVKPLSLMRWLVRLVAPSGGLVLDPFHGSGTTAEACVLEGMRCIGIESESSHIPLALIRLARSCLEQEPVG